MSIISESDQPIEPFSTDGTTAAVLGAVAGFIDAAGLLTLFGLLPAHVTADLVASAASSAATVRVDAATRMLMVPLFILSVTGTAVLARALRRRGAPTVPPLLGLMTVALTAFCLSGVMLAPYLTNGDNWATCLAGGSAVIAMGVQNTLMRGAFSGLRPTTVMTGNLTQVIIDTVEIILLTSEKGRKQRDAARRQALARMAPFGMPLAGFLIGAVLGGWLTYDYGLVSVALPAHVVGALSFIAAREARRQAASGESVRPSRPLFHRQAFLSRPDL